MGRLTPLPFWPPRSFLVGKVSLTSRMRNMWSLSCIWAGLRLSFHLSFCYGISVHRGWTPFAQPGTQISPASPPPYVCMCVCVCVCVCTRTCVHAQSCMTPCSPMDCTLPGQAPLSMGFPRQNTRVGCHFLTQGLNLCLWCLLMLACGFFTPVPPGKPHYHWTISLMNFPEYFCLFPRK